MVTYIFETAASIFQCFVGINFIIKFNRSTWLKSKLAFPIFVLILSIVLVGDHIASGFSTYISSLITIIYFIFAFMICQKKYVRGILSVCIEQSVIIIVGSLLYAIFSALLNDFDMLLQGSDSIGRFIYVIISNLLIFTVLQLALAIFISDDILDVKTGIIAFIMSIVTLIGMSISMSLAELPFSKEIESQILILTILLVSINVSRLQNSK